MRLVFSMLEILVVLVLVILCAPSFVGGQVSYPLDWVNPLIPAASWNGGLVSGLLSFALRALVLLIVIAAGAGLVRLCSRRFR